MTLQLCSKLLPAPYGTFIVCSKYRSLPLLSMQKSYLWFLEKVSSTFMYSLLGLLPGYPLIRQDFLCIAS